MECHKEITKPIPSSRIVSHFIKVISLEIAECIRGGIDFSLVGRKLHFLIQISVETIIFSSIFSFEELATVPLSKGYRKNQAKSNT